MNTVNLNEAQIFINLQLKLNHIGEILEKIKNYSQSFDNSKHVEYLQKLLKVNNLFNNLEAISVDLYNEYILQSESNLLSEEDKNEQKNIRINKKVNDIFLPYILYLQILLSNNQ